MAQFDTYQEVTDCGQKPLSTRWVVTNKDGNTKARLVVRGFEEKDLEIPRDSPTVGKGAMRLFLSIAAIEEWTVKTTDIRSAFLQGKELDRDVYIRPPKESGAPKHVIWKLKHGLYGLKDGARQFYESVKEELINLGFIQCKLDPAANKASSCSAKNAGSNLILELELALPSAMSPLNLNAQKLSKQCLFQLYFMFIKIRSS